LVFGVLKDKAALEMLRELVPFFDEILLTRPGTDRARDPESLAPLLSTEGKKTVSIFPSVKEALTSAVAPAGRNDFILVTGSLYTVGEATTVFQALKPTLTES
jgi:folylpolyglutamate synthase/dihydropteroate synthase